MRYALAAILAGIAACTASPDPLPTCAALGCAAAPSGDPVSWVPCDPGDEVCYCGAPPVACDPTEDDAHR